MRRVPLNKAEKLAQKIKHTVLGQDLLWDETDQTFFVSIDDKYSVVFIVDDKSDETSWYVMNDTLYVPVGMKYNEKNCKAVFKNNIIHIPTLLVHEATHLLQDFSEDIDTDDYDIWVTDPYEMNAVHNEWLYSQKHNVSYQYFENPCSNNDIVRSLSLYGYNDIPPILKSCS